MSNEVEVNSHGTNKAIKFNILPDIDMKTAGFRLVTNSSLYGDYWYCYKSLQNDITFNVHIPVDGSEGWIDVLDEDFGQPYDYQLTLERDNSHPFANIIKEKVEYWMNELKKVGIIEGHEYGDYI